MTVIRRQNYTLHRLLAAILLAAALPLIGSAAPDAATSVLRFVIEDGHDVQSDGLGDYVDFRLLTDPNDATDSNHCMETMVGSSMTFLFFNRDLDATGGAGVVKCDDPVARRQFILHIDSQAVCDELMNNNYGESDGGSGCFLHGYRNPRIRVGKLFANRPRTTPIDFLIGRNTLINPPDAPTYEIQSDGAAAISASGDVRTIEYGSSPRETFHLVRFGGEAPSTKGKGGGSTPPWALPFRMTLRMTFTLESVAP